MVHAIFYNFADGEVARHIPRVWDTITPEAALAAREQGSVAALRRILGDLADAPGLGRAADLAAAGIGGTQAQVLHALSKNIPAGKFGRVHHLAADRLARVVDGMQARGLIDASGWLGDAGRTTKERIEALTDDLAAPAYSSLEPGEFDRLIAYLGVGTSGRRAHRHPLRR